MIVACLAGAATPAAAEGDAEEAKLRFSRAELAYKLGRFKEAVAEYEAAYRALPAAAFLFNIAQAYRQQYGLDKDSANLQKALALYRSYLREAKQPPNRQTVIRLIGELEQVLVALRQEAERQQRSGRLALGAGSNAAGAAARLDGKAIGRLPLSREVAPGGHFVQVDRRGFKPWSAAISVAPEAEVKLSISLVPLSAVAASQQGDQRRAATSPSARPFYKRWWFWTAVGAVAVAGGVTAVALASEGEDRTGGIPTLDLR